MIADIIRPESGTTDRIIVNCGIRSMYENRHRKLKEALHHHCGKDTAFLLYSDYPDGCPEHHDRQYAFKIYAMREAIKAGFRFVLWMDCAFIPRAPIEPVWNRIREYGWYVPRQGDSFLGTWISDSALAFCGIDRKTADAIPLAFSGLVGLDMGNDTARTIWAEWQRHYEAGVFNGPHRNIPGAPMEPWGHKTSGHVSDDPKVEGHRHDEASLSFILWQNHLEPARAGFITFESPDAIIGHQIS
jgi:hypothetical protein